MVILSICILHFFFYYCLKTIWQIFLVDPSPSLESDFFHQLSFSFPVTFTLHQISVLIYLVDKNICIQEDWNGRCSFAVATALYIADCSFLGSRLTICVVQCVVFFAYFKSHIYPYLICRYSPFSRRLPSVYLTETSVLKVCRDSHNSTSHLKMLNISTPRCAFYIM